MRIQVSSAEISTHVRKAGKGITIKVVLDYVLARIEPWCDEMKILVKLPTEKLVELFGFDPRSISESDVILPPPQTEPMKPTRLRIVQNDDQPPTAESPRGVKSEPWVRGSRIVSHGGSILLEMPVMIKEGRKAQRRKTAR